MEDTPDHIKKFTAVLSIDGKEYTSIANRSAYDIHLFDIYLKRLSFDSDDGNKHITEIIRDDVSATCTPSADRGLDEESSGGEQPTKLE